MGASKPPPPKPSSELVRDIVRATLTALVQDEAGGHDWMAVTLRQHGWSVLAPAGTMEGKG